MSNEREVSLNGGCGTWVIAAAIAILGLNIGTVAQKLDRIAVALEQKK